jgi:hypothetical protein
MKTRTLLVIAALAFALASPVSAAVPTVTLESQGWWSQSGLVIPGAVGAHIHVLATVPADGYPTDGLVAVPVTVTAHDQIGAITLLRVSDGSTVMQSWPLALGPCANCSWSGTVTVDFSTWPSGRREMRWTANIPVNSLGNRQYQSTGWQVCIRSCTPSYRSGPYVEARGWYTGRGYQNARLTSALSTVVSGGTITVKLAPGSGGKPTVFSGVYLDPDFHAGNSGTVLLTRTGPYSGVVVIPVLAPGPHRLVLLSSDGLNAGVLAIPFSV